jgi:AraC family transcriptional regulator
MAAFWRGGKTRVLQTSSHPDFASEERYIVGRAHYSGKAGGQRLSVRRTRVLKRDPDLALTYGGNEGHIARLYLHATEPSKVHQGKRTFVIPPRVAMETSFRDVHDSCAWPVAHPVDQIVFDLPTAAVAGWAEDHALANRLLRDLQSGLSVADPVLKAFGLAIIPALKRPDPDAQFFVDTILDGVCSHVFKSFTMARRVSRGGLAAWQERRAKEMMESRIAADLSLEDLARECGLSVSHFARAFRQSCGTTPYKWLMSRRIERARDLLHRPDLPLAMVAAECGFADQAHFTNVFTRMVGHPPGAFRRYRLHGPERD